MSAPDTSDDFEALLDYVRRNRGFDFTTYKRPSLVRRITKRMHTVGVDSPLDYADYLALHPDEFGQLFDTILINVTSFFRDAPAWRLVADEIIPRLLEATDGQPVRVWSTGCATGEEALTVAMLLAEALGEDEFRERVKIYATDVDEDALAAGRQAAYDDRALEPVPEPLREKYFVASDGRYVFRPDLRRSVIFGRHDVIQDPPISRIDLVVARNTLMYFTPETQAKVLANFHFALRPHGYLFLGKSEVLLSRSNLFVPVDLKRRVFAPVQRAGLRDRLLTMVEDADVRPPRPAVDGRLRAREAAFDVAPVAQILVDREGQLGLANSQARALFGLSPRDVGRPLQDLELSYRPVELRSLMDEVNAKGQPVAVVDVEWSHAGDRRFFDVQLTPLAPDEDGSPVGVAITFLDVTRYRILQDLVERGRKEIETAYEELQSAAEELETTNEELQSTNEELETTNEELQSTNEELETMNEELQSTNEELETMNEELRQRTDALDAVNMFLETILRSLHVGVVVVDAELRVQAWNDTAADLFGLRADEVHGQYLLNLGIGLPLEELMKPLRRSLANGEATEVVVEAVTPRGRTIGCKISITPMASQHDGSAGLILLIEPQEAAAGAGA